MTTSPRKHSLLLTAGILLICAVDQTAKYLVVHEGFEACLLTGALCIGYVQNPELAFGWNPSYLPRPLWTPIALAGLVWVTIQLGKRAQNGCTTAGLCLINGGGLSNLIDRVLPTDVLAKAGVVDWIQLKSPSFTVFEKTYQNPAFNLADVALVIGSLAFIWVLVTEKDSQRETPS